MSTALTRYQSTYVAKQALFNLFGNTFRLFNADGSLAFYVKKKMFKLKEDIVIYADEAEKEPMLRIKARSIMIVYCSQCLRLGEVRPRVTPPVAVGHEHRWEADRGILMAEP